MKYYFLFCEVYRGMKTNLVVYFFPIYTLHPVPTCQSWCLGWCVEHAPCNAASALMSAVMCGQPEGILPPVTSGKLCMVCQRAVCGLHISPPCRLHPDIHVSLWAWGKVLESYSVLRWTWQIGNWALPKPLQGLLLQAATARDSGCSWGVSNVQHMFNDIIV